MVRLERKMVAATKNSCRLLGQGLYTPAEAALYARIPTATLMRWMWGTGNRRSAFRPRFDVKERFVSFHDFVTALAIREIRQEKGVSLQRIREAIDYAENKHGLQYPLARKHVTWLMPNGRIAINVAKAGEPEFIEAAGRAKGNRLIRPIAEFFLTQCSWDADELASSYTALNYKNHEIVLNPQVRLGEPIVTSCGYTAETLWDAYRVEGGVENVARAYGVKPSEVEAACYYMTSLPAAA